MRVVLHSIHSKGGLTEHVNYQARALACKGHDVVLLGPRDFLQGRTAEYAVERIYSPLHSQKKGQGANRRWFSLIRRTVSFLLTQWRLAWEVFRRKPDFVLLDSYIEYLSPFWILPHWLLAKFRGVCYVANLHDPVRDFRVGPLWWHNWSVKVAYAPIKIAVVHQRLLGKQVAPQHVSLVEAPVGVYELRESEVDSASIRRAWGAQDGQVVFLSFGFIRDNKNLDLLIKALAENPCALLVVMGSAQSSRNKPLKFYQDLAEEAGVARRVVFREEFVPDEALAGYFAAADVIAITYDSHFHSQSGVLNIAASARRPVIASSGESPLRTAVERFRLGEFVEPDDQVALASGMRRLTLDVSGAEPSGLRPDWSGYERYASWETNVGIILDAVSEAAQRVK